MITVAGDGMITAAGPGDGPAAGDGAAETGEAGGEQQAGGRRRRRAATRGQGPPESFAQPSSPLPGFQPVGPLVADAGPAGQGEHGQPGEHGGTPADEHGQPGEHGGTPADDGGAVAGQEPGEAATG
jgi:hypothetical protein